MSALKLCVGKYIYFLEFVAMHKLWALNTWFQKDIKKLCTHKHHGVNAFESDWTYNTFDQYDYILTEQ